MSQLCNQMLKKATSFTDATALSNSVSKKFYSLLTFWFYDYFAILLLNLYERSFSFRLFAGFKRGLEVRRSFASPSISLHLAIFNRQGFLTSSPTTNETFSTFFGFRHKCTYLCAKNSSGFSCLFPNLSITIKINFKAQPLKKRLGCQKRVFFNSTSVRRMYFQGDAQ